MFDADTANLIRQAPALEGLNNDDLPDILSEAFAQIVAARIRLREPGDDAPGLDDELLAQLSDIRRLAATQEAFVAGLPEREDRAQAAFVAAAAHQLSLSANRLIEERDSGAFVDPRTISPDISAMLLFMVAEATADAGEVARTVNPHEMGPIESSLIQALRAMAQGRLVAATRGDLPQLPDRDTRFDADQAASALYLMLLQGVRNLAVQMLGAEPPHTVAGDLTDPASIFEHVAELCFGETVDLPVDVGTFQVSLFSGPHHLASLLIALGRDLPACALVITPSPAGVPDQQWAVILKRFAKSQPYLWRNHRQAIESGYLDPGKSAAVSFPTGAGKSTLAELKIAATLLLSENVVFLAPTLALVDQTARAMKKAFPEAIVQREKADELGFDTVDSGLPEILVMTPEGCLALLASEPGSLEATGLLVFDECHLLHPSDPDRSRRALDAMLCVLNFTTVAPEADLLFLSAMMKNADEFAEWLKALTGRDCLALTLKWKPTRQLRGSIVYDSNNVEELNQKLVEGRQTSTNVNTPKNLKEQLTIQPFGFFSLKQTWDTQNKNDYSLLPLLYEPVTLGSGTSKGGTWYLTPNAGVVSSAIASACADCGIKTLVFFQTIKNAARAANRVSETLRAAPLELTENEQGLVERIVAELGSKDALYFDLDDENRIDGAAIVHHGLLLPDERQLHESLFKRQNGLRVLTATSTLAQGMNLPSEMVIIAEDSRFNKDAKKRELLEASELLNAAGRAGRAGQNAYGVVLIVPGQVTAIDLKKRRIDRHWSTLREIFSQSDQCLDIEDPLTAILDRIHQASGTANDLESYCVGRLQSCGAADSDPDARLKQNISKSFAAFRAKKSNDEDWIMSRVDAAIALRKSESDDNETTLEDQIAGRFGFATNIVSSLSEALKVEAPDANASVTDWRNWIFRWLKSDPDLVFALFRVENIEGLFGETKLKSFKNQKEASDHISLWLNRLLKYWIGCHPLTKLERVWLGDDEADPKQCSTARKFIVRIVPELSYLFNVAATLQKERLLSEARGAESSAVLELLGACIRNGFSQPEKYIFHAQSRGKRTRRQTHRHFRRLIPHMPVAPPGETALMARDRVDTAIMAELNAR